MIDDDLLQEAKDRLCDRYTADELVELLDISAEEIIDTFINKIFYWTRVSPELEELFGSFLEEDEDDS